MCAQALCTGALFLLRAAKQNSSIWGGVIAQNASGSSEPCRRTPKN